MLLAVGTELKPVAVMSLYGERHKELYKASSKTYWTAQHLRDSAVHVIDINTINTVIMMAPDRRYPEFFQDGSQLDRWYLVEKPGLKLSADSDEFIPDED
jgi:hypothetical protein